jgi:DNA-directed RNA polymerase specialized sigma24 family protein
MTMSQTEQRASPDARLEEHATRLRGLAFRLLGELRAADDAVEQVRSRWWGCSSAPTDARAWSTRAMGEICLGVLRTRVPSTWHVPDVVVTDGDAHPERDSALLSGSVGAAHYVALETLSAKERVAFVLHDVADVPFADVGDLIGEPAATAERLAAVGRDRVGAAPAPDADLAGQRQVVKGYFRAAGQGDVDAVRAFLHDDVVLRADAGPHAISDVVTDVASVARRVIMFSRIPSRAIPALVNGAAGVVVVAQGTVASVVAVTVVRGRIAEIDALVDPARIAGLDLSAVSAL